jgi:hypothetical protein
MAFVVQIDTINKIIGMHPAADHNVSPVGTSNVVSTLPGSFTKQLIYQITNLNLYAK